MNNKPTISVIIPSLNSSRTIESCLDGVLDLDYPKDKIHIMVIDHGSTDSTKDIVFSRGVEYHSIPEAKTIGELRNRGVEIACNDIIAFLDSDCIPYPDWLSSAIDTLDQHDVNITGFDYQISDNPTWIEKLWYDMRKQTGIQENVVIPAGNFIIKRATLSSVGGFDVNLISGEDTDICLRLAKKGYRIISSPSIKVIHLNEPKTLGQHFRKQVWHGSGMYKVPFRHFNIHMAKAPLISLLFFVGIVMSLVLIVFGHYSAAGLTTILIVFCVPFSLSIIKYIHGKHRNIFGGTLLYSVYFLARVVSIIKYNLYGDILKLFGNLFIKNQ